MIIKMVSEIKLTVVHFSCPSPMDKKLGNQNWATGSMGLQASGLAGPSGCWASVSSRAGGRGPVGCRGPWAAGRWTFRPLGLRAAGPLGCRGPRACF